LSARVPLAAVAVVAALALLMVQLAADGLYGTVATPGSFPRALAGDWPFELAQRTGLDRIDAVRVALARGALVRGEPQRATALLAALPATATVVDVRGRIALASGDPAVALHDFAAAGDFIAAQSALDDLGARDPVAALAIVRDFERTLEAGVAGPEIAAEVEWREGQIAALAAARNPARANAYLHEALAAYGRALALAPDDEKYLLNDAFVARELGDAAGACATYARAAQVVPGSADALAGLASGRCAP
jgi:tetratricopeptide (TPR) repeat protein